MSHTETPSATQQAGGAMVPPAPRTPPYVLPVPKSEDGRVEFGDFVHWTARQREAQAVSVAHRHTLYGGAAGGGKSYWLRWALIEDLIFWFAQYGLKGVRVGMFCETFPALHDRQIARLQYEVPRWLGKYNEQTHELRLTPGYGAGVLCFRNLDDPSKYLSAEFAGMAFDELTRAKEDQYDFLASRLRWPNLPAQEYRIRNGSNPGGIGHAWVRRRWIDRQFQPYERPEDYAFVPAKVADNPHLPVGYADSLRHLPEKLKRAYLDGDWDVFEGQYFSELSRERHGFDGEPPPGWNFRAFDYGESSPSACYWLRVDYDGHLWAYRELYGAGMIYSAFAQRVLELTAADEAIRYTVAPPDVFAVMRGGGITGAEVLQDNGLAVVPASRSGQVIMGRVEGWRVMREWLAGGRLHVHTRNCRNWWRTVPSLIHDEHNPEDLDSDSEDHAADAMRYALVSRPEPDSKAAVPDLRPMTRLPEDIIEMALLAQGRLPDAEEEWDEEEFV